MKVTYKGCEIEVTKEKCLGGWQMTYYSIYDDGFEVKSGFSESEDTVREWVKDLKKVVDDYRENPQDYDDDFECC